MNTVASFFFLMSWGFASLWWQGLHTPLKNAKPKFTIGKETTYVTGPETKDGYIDYVTALNKRLSKGVTPENNANVLLWKAFGPHPEGTTMPPEFFKWLGITPLPEKGNYFVNMRKFSTKHLKVDEFDFDNKFYDQIERVTKEPWKADKYPDVAKWLKANEKPLALVTQATKRTHYYLPLIPATPEGSLIGALLPSAQQCRELATALTARAMLRTSQSRYEEAWQDLQTCHRLGRLTARGGTLIEGLVGIAIDAIASEADLAYLENAKLSAKQVKACLRDLQQLPPMPGLAEKVNSTERFTFLEAIMLVDREGLDAMTGPNQLFQSTGAEPQIPLQLTGRVDWDPALRKANQFYDRIVKAMRIKDHQTKIKELEKIEQDLKSLRVKNQELNVGQALSLLLSPQARGEKIGDIMLSLFLPAVIKVQQANDRSHQVHQNLQIAFALGAYQKEHGRYPRRLNSLVPQYLPEIPPDIFTGKPLVYRSSERGYLLYSFGIDGQDDGGLNWDDEPGKDDLRIRMPLPKKG